VINVPAIDLQPFSWEEMPRLCSWRTSERDLLAWGGPYYRHPLTVSAVATVLTAAVVTEGSHQLFRVWARDLGEVIGHAELLTLCPRHRDVRLGRLLIGPPDLRGRGYGEALVQTLLRMAFRDLRPHRCELEAYDFNAPALRGYERGGFRP
jgi:RimJ/RimL family protein N-acetyltransferase